MKTIIVGLKQDAFYLAKELKLDQWTLAQKVEHLLGLTSASIILTESWKALPDRHNLFWFFRECRWTRPGISFYDARIKLPEK